MDFNTKLKNLWVWAGIVGSALLAAGVDWTTLTDWGLLVQALIGVVQNPVALISFTATMIAVFVNPNTPGLRD